MKTRAITDYTGPHQSDFTSLQGRLVDLESCRGLRTDQEGFPRVVAEIAGVAPAARTASGVPQGAYDHFLMCNQTVAEIDQQLAIVSKQFEVLKESRAYYVDARNNDIALMVDGIRSWAQRRKDPSLLVPFEQTIRYHGQIAEKAVKARQKKAREAAAAAVAEAAAGNVGDEGDEGTEQEAQAASP
ncbi:MAG TPA: hypothetical protein VLS89_15455 [Candidatus Nanopelagicales bacterium]|nr:hypothetical protein [Candidatus Nanopelagicales bacterium]